MKTKTFTAMVNEQKVDLMVRSPSINDQREAQKVYNHAFTDAVKSKAVVRAKLDDLLQDQGLWNDEKQAKFSTLQQQILDGERRLAKGGFSLKEAKQLAMDMKKHRDEIRELISVKTSLDNHSAEGQADNARFNYLVSTCLVYNDSKQPYFKDMEDYLNRIGEDAAIKGAQNLASMLYGLDNDYESGLPENKFLKKFKFVDDKLRLIDKQGRLIDIEGRLVDENGRFIDEQGNFVDKFGNRVDEEGSYIVDTAPFLDDDGNPIIVDETNNGNTKTETQSSEPVVEPVSAEATVTENS
jgi:hypothetical protein